MHEAMDETLELQRKTLAIPRRLDPMIKELWLAQPRFLQRSRAKAFRLLGQPRFRACYDFFELRAEAGAGRYLKRPAFGPQFTALGRKAALAAPVAVAR